MSGLEIEVFRICTEDKNREAIARILDSHVDGYALFYGTGCWKGQHEDSVSIDIIGAERATVYAIADEIRIANEQESVLVYEIDAKAVFIDARSMAA